MALKTAEKVKPEVSAPQPPQTTVLELALYTQYTWQGTTYEKGKPYRFRNADAMKLLAERDTNRQVWRLYQPPLKREAPKQDIVDATAVTVPEPYDDPLPGTNTGKRIEVGNDDEIRDVLDRPDDPSEDVTV